MAILQSIITSDVVGIQGPRGTPGNDGTATPAPYRAVSGTSNTPTEADKGGIIDFTANAPVTITANDLGEDVSYSVWQIGTGQLSVVAGEDVTLVSGSANISFQTPRQYSALVIRCLGNGTVIVLGEQAAS